MKANNKKDIKNKKPNLADRKDNKHFSFSNIFKTIEGLTLIVIILQWGLSYLFINYLVREKDKAYIELSKKETDKIVIQLKNIEIKDQTQIMLFRKQIEEIDENLKTLRSDSNKILDKLAIQKERKVILSIERDILKDIIPNIKIDCKVIIYGTRIILKMLVENIGKFPVLIGKPIVYIATKPFNKSDDSNDFPLPKDYYKINIPGIGRLAEKNPIHNDMIIDLYNFNNIPDNIYFKIIYNVETDHIILKSAEQSLTNTKKSEIYQAAKLPFSYSGNIEVSSIKQNSLSY